MNLVEKQYNGINTTNVKPKKVYEIGDLVYLERTSENNPLSVHLYYCDDYTKFICINHKPVFLKRKVIRIYFNFEIKQLKVY